MTPRNERFIELYIQYVVLQKAPNGKRNSASQAYVDAGYNSKNSDVDAFKLLEKPSIAEAIEKRKNKILNKYEITTESIAAELSKIAYVDVAEYYDKNKNVIIWRRL